MYASVCWDKDNIVQKMESKTTSVMDEWQTDRDKNAGLEITAGQRTMSGQK